MAWGKNRNSATRIVDGITVAESPIFRRARGDPERFSPKPRPIYCGDCDSFLLWSALQADSYRCRCGTLTEYGEVKV
jgi:hypothetical protein